MIPLCTPYIQGNEWKYIKECLDTGWVSSAGNFADLFEEKFKHFVESKWAIAATNGTAALTLALQTLGIKPGDEVIVPSLTFISSVNCIRYVGAKPVFADITDDTWVLDVPRMEQLITKKTKAIIPVHLYGNVVDMQPLMDISRRNNLFVIEDATEALGAKYRDKDGLWRYAGTLGHFGAFSFNGNKMITTGAGGMLVANDGILAERARYLSNQAKRLSGNGVFHHDEIGYNYRMPNILAAMGIAQLEDIHARLERKKAITETYNSILSHTRGIITPVEKENVKHANWLYTILANGQYPLNRDKLISLLKENNIEARALFYPIHMMKPYFSKYRPKLEVTCRIASQGLNLPSSVSISNDEIKMIAALIVEAI